MPVVSLPLHTLAGLVAYSRVHTGVHYPLDVVVGSLLGASMGQVGSMTPRLRAEAVPVRRRSA
jgi:membrane-associated phospholipid phosphatase